MVAYDDTGGIPVEPDATLTSLVTGPGQVRYGDTLMGSATPAGWVELVGWRDLPQLDVDDEPRPQSHGDYPGSVLAQSAIPTFSFLLRGLPDAKALALAAIERATRPDGVDRPLIVNDGTGATYRMARVIGRTIPQEKHFQHAPLACSVQWKCADPRRYSLTERVATTTPVSTVGGLEYPLDYPLDYGVSTGSSAAIVNDGNASTPLVATFTGPLESPRLTAPEFGWSLGFDLNLSAGETLTVNTYTGTVLLDGADRLYTISGDSAPLEECLIPPGSGSVNVTALSGTGAVRLTYRDAYL